MTDRSPKNRLQEYCQKEKLPLPVYRILKQSGPPHQLHFQAQVAVNKQRYIGEDLCLSKIAAHHSAALKACQMLIIDDIDRRSIEHLPSEYTDIEQFMDQMVGSADGRIRKIRPVNADGTYRFEITGSYRYCENIHRHHKANQIYFIVDPIKRTFYQRCYDPNCRRFRSRSRCITTGQTIAIPLMPENLVDKCPRCQKQMAHNRRIECERCEVIVCAQCLSTSTLSHEAMHCSRCRELLRDAYDSS